MQHETPEINVNFNHPKVIKAIHKIMDERKIIKYVIICTPIEYIDKYVNDAILDGWQPFGGISHLWDMNEEVFSFCQAMVKYE